jgi:hypothetical protein
VSGRCRCRSASEGASGCVCRSRRRATHLDEPDQDARALKHIVSSGIIIHERRDPPIRVDLEVLWVLLLLVGEAEAGEVVRQRAVLEVGIGQAELLEEDGGLVPVGSARGVEVQLGRCGRAGRGLGELGRRQRHGADGAGGEETEAGSSGGGRGLVRECPGAKEVEETYGAGEAAGVGEGNRHGIDKRL